jgi:uncharacterized OB-fold protein
MNTYYLNRSGSRWVNMDARGNRQKARIFFPENGTIKSYSIQYFEAMGQFAVAVVRIKGKNTLLMDWENGLHLVNNEANRKFKYNNR